MIKVGLRLSVFLLCGLIGIASTWLSRALTPVELPKAKTTVPVDVSAEIEAVYQSVLDREFKKDGVTRLVIQDATTGCPLYEDRETRIKFGPANKSFAEIVSEGLRTAETSTIENYLESNKTSERIAIHSDRGNKFVLVGEKELATLFREDEFDRAWTRFYAKYPKSSGLVFLSKIGFNTDYTQAMIYAGRQCGGLCGSGSYLVLNKKNGVWIVESRMGLWVS